MKVHSNFTGPKSKKRLIAFSCATALASFAFIARPAFAEEAKVDNSSNLDTTAATTTNVETTADLVETKVVEAPATTENVASTESTTNVSEQATTSTASSETASETTSTTASESQAPAESASGQTREAVTTDRATNDTTSTRETNITGGQYYSDDQGNWYYKDANGKNLVGEQTIDGQNVYFRSNGQQVKGPLIGWKNRLFRYYDVDTGQLWTNRYLEYQGNWYYLGENGYPLAGEQTINGQEVYFDYKGVQIKGDFSGETYSYPHMTFYYDADSGARVRKEGLVNDKGGKTYYLNNDGSKFTGVREIDGNLFYFKIYDATTPVYIGSLQKGISISLEEGKNSPRGNSYGYGNPTKITRRYYFDPITGQAVKNRYVQENDGWYYYAEDGNAIRPQDGEVNIDGQIVYV